MDLELSPIILSKWFSLDERMLDIITTTNIHIMDVTEVIIKPDGYVDHAIALCLVTPNDIIVPVAIIKIIATIGLCIESDCFFNE